MKFANLEIVSSFNLHDNVVNSVFNPLKTSEVRLSGSVKIIRYRDLSRTANNGM